MRAVWRSDIGRRRASNQDAYLVMPATWPLYAVADGMGGHRGGDVASAMAVQGLRTLLQGMVPSQSGIRLCYEQISRNIHQRQQQDEQLSGMGTTLTLLWEAEDRVFIGHVGDSRAYLLRAGTLTQITQDHSLVNEMLRTGALDRNGAREYPYRNVITRAVGTEDTVVSDVHVLDKQPLDRWLLCSDGLSEYFDDISLHLAIHGVPLEEAADTLMQRALDMGGQDNVTFILLEAAP